MKKLAPAIFSYLFLALYIGIIIFIRGKIPSPDVLLASLQELYTAYGYPLIFVGALLEAMFLVSFYVPGSTVVLFGAALSRSGITSFPLVIILGVIGFLCGYCINYCLGRFGWYNVLSQFGLEGGIDVAKEKLRKNAFKAIFLGYFFPGSASFISTAAGVLRMPFPKFVLLSLFAEFFWALVWGGIAYYFGLSLIEFILKYFPFVIIIGVILWLGKRYLFSKRSKR